MAEAKVDGNGKDAYMARNTGAGITAELLERAVALAVITPEQRAMLLAMRGPAEAEYLPASEAGFTLVLVGYWAGSIAVLFALGWFLVDRWKSLRPAGVLGVVLVYAILFLASSRILSRMGFRIAAGLLTLLAVGLAPIVAWCVASLLGLWPSATLRRDDPFTTDLIATIRWIPIELSTALAALVALRRVPFGLLALAVTIPMGMALIHLTPWLFDPDLDRTLWGWMALLVSTGLLGAGYVSERRAGSDEHGYPNLIYLSAAGFLFTAIVAVADQSRAIPHALPAVVIALTALSLAIRRGVFLLLAAIVFVGYLGFLAADVFASAFGFMYVMLATGSLLIFLTILAQRRFPAIMRRLSAEGRGSRPPPRLGYVFLATIGIAIVLLAAAVPRGRDRQAQYFAERRQLARQSGEARRARDAAQRARRREQPRVETPIAPRP